MGKDKKRTGPKSTRAGCLLCKPHKHQGTKSTKDGVPRQERLARIEETEQLEEAQSDDSFLSNDSDALE